MKQQITYIFFIFLLSTSYVEGQTADSSYTISMAPFELEKKVCILFENDSYIVLTSTKVLENIYGHPSDSTSWPNRKSNLFLDCYNNSDTLDLYSCSRQKSLDHVSVKMVANLISKSECVIYNRKTNLLITKLIVKPYSRFDVGGKEYYSEDGNLLFRTIEWIN